MAQFVAKHASSVKIPEYINTVFVRAIRYRREVTSWYRTRETDSGKDARHDAFADCLQNALDILRPYMPRTEMNRQRNDTTRTSKATSYGNQFGGLKVHDILDDDSESIDTPIDARELPPVPEVNIGTDESDIEEDFFFQIKAFLDELERIRVLVLLTWQFKETDLITRSIVTNTTIDLVRRMEYEMEWSLVRPAKYPTAKFPTGCLPALLLYRDVDLEPTMREHGLTMEKVIMPSTYVLNSLAFSELGQQHAKLCFYPVYNRLKYFCSGIDPRRLSKAKQAKKEREGGVLFGNALETLRGSDLGPVNFGFFEAAEWAHCLYLADRVFKNRLSEDEVTRGIRHISETFEVSVWVTFGMQLHVELRTVLSDSIGEAFKEVQRDIVMTSYRDNALVASKNPLAVYRNVLTKGDYLKCCHG
jgi:hypothetical protein